MNNFENLAEIKKTSEEIYDGVILHVYRDTVTLPDGKTQVALLKAAKIINS